MDERRRARPRHLAPVRRHAGPRRCLPPFRDASCRRRWCGPRVLAPALTPLVRDLGSARRVRSEPGRDKQVVAEPVHAQESLAGPNRGSATQPTSQPRISGGAQPRVRPSPRPNPESREGPNRGSATQPRSQPPCTHSFRSGPALPVQVDADALGDVAGLNERDGPPLGAAADAPRTVQGRTRFAARLPASSETLWSVVSGTRRHCARSPVLTGRMNCVSGGRDSSMVSMSCSSAVASAPSGSNSVRAGGPHHPRAVHALRPEL